MENVTMTGSILSLLTSRKAIVMLFSIIAVSALAALGKIAGNDALDFVRWVVLVWIGSQAAVDAITRRTPCQTPSTSTPMWNISTRTESVPKETQEMSDVKPKSDT
jgi:hypothetical protein